MIAIPTFKGRAIPGGWPGLLIAGAVLPYFIVRGWVSATTVLLGLGALAVLTKERRWREVAAQPALLAMMAALASPLLAAALIQAVHGQFIARSFDPLAHLAVAGFLLAFLYLRRTDWLPLARVVLPLALLLGVAWIYTPWIQKYHVQWGGRVASQFMDPLMLAQHASLAAFLCLFMFVPGQRRALTALQGAAVVAGIGLSIATGSRTGWGMIPVIALLWLVYLRKLQKPHQMLAGIMVVAVLVFALYEGSDTVRQRLAAAAHEIESFFNGGNRVTSVGLRLTMYGLTWEAFLAKPLWGWGFTEIPTPETLPAIAKSWNATLFEMLAYTGTHNEWLQNILRMGVFGLFSRLAMYGVPLVIFLQAARATADAGRRQAGFLGLALMTGYLTAGITTEVTHLVFTASFFGLMVAALGAVALPSPRTP